MKCYLIIFFALIASLFIYADEYNDEDDCDLIERKFSFFLGEMERHREEALKFMRLADQMTPYIPDLGKQQHMHAIIGSGTAALLMREPKVAILSVGFSLISSLSVDMYDKFCEYRLVILQAAHHQDMFYFYESMSRKVSTLEIMNKGTQAFMQAIDCLTLCGALIYSFEDKYGSEKAEGLNHIADLYYYFKNKFKKTNYKLTEELARRFYEKGVSLYENLDTLLSECNEIDLRDKINYNIREMIQNLEVIKANTRNQSVMFIIGE